MSPAQARSGGAPGVSRLEKGTAQSRPAECVRVMVYASEDGLMGVG